MPTRNVCVSVEDDDWQWLQDNKKNLTCKASYLLRQAIRERKADEGEVWKSKRDLQKDVKQMQKAVKAMWQAIEKSLDKDDQSSVMVYYQELLNASQVEDTEPVHVANYANTRARTW